MESWKKCFKKLTLTCILMGGMIEVEADFPPKHLLRVVSKGVTPNLFLFARAFLERILNPPKFLRSYKKYPHEIDPLLHLCEFLFFNGDFEILVIEKF